MSFARRVLLAAMLAMSAPAACGIAPVLAAAIPGEPDAERRTHYTPTAQTGPLSVGFDLYADNTDYSNWIEVYVNGVLMTQSGNWTLTSPSGSLSVLARPITDAVINFTNPQTGTVDIVGARRPRRVTQFQENAPIPAHAQNQVLTDLWMTHRERWDAKTRLMLGPPGETIGPLPSAAVRANKFLGFDASGNPVPITPTGGAATGDVFGPSSAAADSNIALFNGLTGKIIKDSGVSLASISRTINSIDVYAIGGQSNAQGTGGNINLSPAVDASNVLQYSSGAISAANDPVGNASPASAWPAFGNTYVRATGRKILFVPSAVGGTDQCSTTGVSAQNWDLTGTLAPALIANVTAAMAAARAAGYAPVYRGILWSQGENDAGSIGTSTTWPVNGSTTITGGPYAAGSTVVTVASATGIVVNEGLVITLDNGSTFTGQITNVVGTTVTLGTGVPVGRTVNTGADAFVYSMAMYRTCFKNMLNYFRTTTTDGTIFPQLPFYIFMTGGPSAGDALGYQKVRLVQEQIENTDPYSRVVYRGALSFIARGMMQTSSLHYLQEGYNEMGREGAKGVIAAQPANEFVKTNERVVRVTLGGTLRNGDQMNTIITSSAITGSPVTLGPLTVVVPPGSTFSSLAATQALNCNLYSPQLQAVGIYCTSYAIAGGAVIEIHQPLTLDPVAVVTGSWITGGATETMAIAAGSSAQGSNPYPPLIWTTFTPALACGTATFTVNAARQQTDTLQKTTRFMVDATIAGLGTCSGNPVTFTLPSTAATYAAFVGHESALTGFAITCGATGASTTASCYKFDGSTTWLVNQRLVVSGAYETP